MKVLNLQCGAAHAFEGWFGSEEDFQSQLARGLVECPLCGDSHITKGLTAPRLNLRSQQPRARGESASRADEQPAHGGGNDGSGDSAHRGGNASGGSASDGAASVRQPAGLPALSMLSPEAQAAYLKAVRHVIANTEDVGDRFAEEARRIHYGEAAERDIRGQASAEEARDLVEEGIEVGQIILPAALKGPLQ